MHKPTIHACDDLGDDGNDQCVARQFLPKNRTTSVLNNRLLGRTYSTHVHNTE